MMIEKKPVLFYVKFGFIAALLYAVSVVFFLFHGEYANSWILYLGNLLFAGVVALHLFYAAAKADFQKSSIGLLKRGHIIAVFGIAISVILCLLLLLIMVPDVFSNHSDVQLDNSPAQLNGHSNGLLFVIFTDLVVGNFGASSFVSFMLPFVVTRAQKGEKEPRKTL